MKRRMGFLLNCHPELVEGRLYSIKSWIRQAHHDIVIISLLLLFFLITCGSKLPEEISPGEHKCEFCKMGVVSQNYHSQVLTKKGRRYHFDSIECMFSFWNSNLDKVDKVWVKDYLHPKDWIEIQNAKFLKADKLPSPMAANLSSYKSEKEAEDNRLLYGGVLMTQEQVMEYVKTNWEKDLSGKREIGRAHV